MAYGLELGLGQTATSNPEHVNFSVAKPVEPPKPEAQTRPEAKSETPALEYVKEQQAALQLERETATESIDLKDAIWEEIAKCEKDKKYEFQPVVLQVTDEDGKIIQGPNNPDVIEEIKQDLGPKLDDFYNITDPATEEQVVYSHETVASTHDDRLNLEIRFETIEDTRNKTKTIRVNGYREKPPTYQEKREREEEIQEMMRNDTNSVKR